MPSDIGRCFGLYPSVMLEGNGHHREPCLSGRSREAEVGVTPEVGNLCLPLLVPRTSL